MDKLHHLLWAATFFLGIYFITKDIIYKDGPTIFISLLICLVYTLIPDLDLKSEWVKNQFNNIILYLIIITIILFLTTTQFNLLLISVILISIEIVLQLLKHKGILHSPLFGIALTIPLYFLNYPSTGYLIGGIIGISSHWVVDKISSRK